MQGWSPDFIPKLTEDAVTASLIDAVIPIAGADALRLSRELARKEGIFVGISSGATLAGALAIAEKAPKGSSVLCMLPDTGERYLTTTLFEDVPTDMTDEEIAISQSTPLCRFDAPPPAPPKDAPVTPQPVTPEGEAFVSAAISDASDPVVMFALEWCEFCWSVRKFFAKTGIPYRSVDLDSVEYQEGDRGGKIRAALCARTAMPTIPQIFVGGEFVGGCTEVFDTFKQGKLQQLLAQSGVRYDEGVEVDPYDLLPTWLHPR
jgi:cysteine synthase A